MKFKINDKVDYVNDYGVIFKDKVIVDIDDKNETVLYYIEPTDAPWMHVYERNLYRPGTYKGKTLQLLNATAEFKGCDWWGNEIYTIVHKGRVVTGAYVDGKMYSYSTEYEEVQFPLGDDFQVAVQY